MKAQTFICILVAHALTTGTVFAQSLFDFNSLRRNVHVPVFDAQGMPLAGSNYLATLYGGMTPDTLQIAWEDLASPLLPMVPVPFLTGTNAGYFRGHEVMLFTYPSGTFAWLQVRVWDARLGATYDQVAGLGVGGYGESPLFYALGGDALRIPPDPGGPLIGLQSFSLRPVPEPSTWALLGLGGLAAGWALRRQRLRGS